jgi:hypothetical protein
MISHSEYAFVVMFASNEFVLYMFIVRSALLWMWSSQGVVCFKPPQKNIHRRCFNPKLAANHRMIGAMLFIWIHRKGHVTLAVRLFVFLLTRRRPSCSCCKHQTLSHHHSRDFSDMSNQDPVMIRTAHSNDGNQSGGWQTFACQLGALFCAQLT